MKTVSELSRRVRFILCEPGHPGNIGMAARAIKTMGFRRLVVVNPRVPDYKTDKEAIDFSTSSVDVLQNAETVSTLADALDGVTFAWALSGYDREFGPRLESIRVAAQESQAWLRNDMGEIAFVFGTERTGLSNEEILQCQGCAAIPADPESSSLNLSQAVQVAAYEMQMALDAGEGTQDEFYAWQSRFEDEKPADLAQVEGFIEHFEKAAIACGALNPEKPKNFTPMVRRLFARSGLTQREIDLLRGVCAAVIRPKAERAGTKKGKL